MQKLLLLIVAALAVAAAPPPGLAASSKRGYACGRLEGLHDAILLAGTLPDQDGSDAAYWRALATLRSQHGMAIVSGLSGWELGSLEPSVRERLNWIAHDLLPRPVEDYNPDPAYWRGVVEAQGRLFEKAQREALDVCRMVCGY